MRDRSTNDRLKRVETEVESLLADVREQVQRLRGTVERMRALRGPDHRDEGLPLRHGTGGRSDDSHGGVREPGRGAAGFSEPR